MCDQKYNYLGSRLPFRLTANSSCGTKIKRIHKRVVSAMVTSLLCNDTQVYNLFNAFTSWKNYSARKRIRYLFLNTFCTSNLKRRIDDLRKMVLPDWWPHSQWFSTCIFLQRYLGRRDSRACVGQWRQVGTTTASRGCMPHKQQQQQQQKQTSLRCSTTDRPTERPGGVQGQMHQSRPDHRLSRLWSVDSRGGRARPFSLRCLNNVSGWRHTGTRRGRCASLALWTASSASFTSRPGDLQLRSAPRPSCSHSHVDMTSMQRRECGRFQLTTWSGGD